MRKINKRTFVLLKVYQHFFVQFDKCVFSKKVILKTKKSEKLYPFYNEYEYNGIFRWTKGRY